MTDAQSPEEREEVNSLYRARLANAQVVASASRWLSLLHAALDTAFVCALQRGSQEIAIEFKTEHGRSVLVSMAIDDDAVEEALSRLMDDGVPVLSMETASVQKESDDEQEHQD